MFGIVSDLHYHDWQNYAKVDSSGKNSRLEDIKNCMSQVLSGTHEAGAKDLWVLGDVFHKRGMVDTISLSYFSDFVAEARHFGIHLHVLVGNHDMATQDSSGYTSLDPWKSAGNVTIYGEDIVVRRGNSTIAVLPYEENHLNLQFKLNRRYN
jgi:DNA repair exonuclease SbcCD nuclease subunit